MSLQGASDAVDTPAGSPREGVAERVTRWGRRTSTARAPQRLVLPVPAHGPCARGRTRSPCRTWATPAVTSLVLPRPFHARPPAGPPVARAGAFEGLWAETGTAEVGGSRRPRDRARRHPPAPRRSGSAGVETTGGLVRFRAEAGRRVHRGLAGGGTLAPRVVRARSSRRCGTPAHQADYLPHRPRRAFLEAALLLVERRAGAGAAGHGGVARGDRRAVRSRRGFGGGDPRVPSPMRTRPGGGRRRATWSCSATRSTDPRNFTGGSVPSPLPALWTKTSYLWTVTDPLVAAVNGRRRPSRTWRSAGCRPRRSPAGRDDRGQAAGVGGLPARGSTAPRLSWRTTPTRPGTSRPRRRNIAEVPSCRAERPPRSSWARSGTRDTARAQILDAFNQGLSLVSYVGHGARRSGPAENMLNSQDTESMQAQSRQPVVLTMNCLNGYFVAPELRVALRGAGQDGRGGGRSPVLSLGTVAGRARSRLPSGGDGPADGRRAREARRRAPGRPAGLRPGRRHARDALHLPPDRRGERRPRHEQSGSRHPLPGRGRPNLRGAVAPAASTTR